MIEGTGVRRVSLPLARVRFCTVNLCILPIIFISIDLSLSGESYSACQDGDYFGSLAC